MFGVQWFITQKSQQAKPKCRWIYFFCDWNIYYQQIRMELSHKLKKGRTVQFNSFKLNSILDRWIWVSLKWIKIIVQVTTLFYRR